MDDLIVLIVRMIVRMLRDKPASPSSRTPARPRPTNAAPPARPQLKPSLVRRGIVTPRGKRPPVLTPTPARQPVAAAPFITKVATAHRDVRSVNAFVGALTPASLRKQIVINEILQPPLALRAER